MKPEGGGAAASGLSQFSADDGFKDIGLSLMGLFHVTKNWHLGGGVYGLVQWEITMAEMLADLAHAVGGRVLPLWVMCGRLLIGKCCFEVCASWSGAVMCPAC